MSNLTLENGPFRTNQTSTTTDKFTTWDYAVLITSFVLSTVIGSAYALCAYKKQERNPDDAKDATFSTDAATTTVAGTITSTPGLIKPKRNDTSDTREYFSGSTLSFVPVTLSLVASRISPITTIGFPVEVYQHGVSIWFFVLGELLGCVFAASFCLPVFYPLEFFSVYELLERRFGSRDLRLLCSALCVIKIAMYLGVVLYGPAVAISSVAPISIEGSILTCGILCCVYTTLGGLRGVIWTDVFQICVMIVSQISIVALGVAKAGGFDTVWKINDVMGRIRLPESTFDFHSRHSFWNIILAPTLEWALQMGASQMAIQRLKGLPSMRQAVVSLIITGVVVVAITSLSMTSGLIITSSFGGCDPVRTKRIRDENQYLPFLALALFRDYPGLAGLFVAAIFSATLSSVSSGINAVANVLWDDFFRQTRYFRELPDRSSSIVVRVISLAYGVIPIAIAFAAKGFGDNIQKMGTVFVAITTGAMNTMFICCYFVRRTNSKGIMVGSFISVLVIGWWVLGGTIHKPPSHNLPEIGPDHCVDDLAAAAADGSLAKLMAEIKAKEWASADIPTSLMRRESKGSSVALERSLVDGQSSASLSLSGSDTDTKGAVIPAIDWSSFPYRLYNMSYLWYQIIGTLIALVFSIIFSLIFDARSRRRWATASGTVFIEPNVDAYIFSFAKLRDGLRPSAAKVDGQQPLSSDEDADIQEVAVTRM